MSKERTTIRPAWREAEREIFKRFWTRLVRIVQSISDEVRAQHKQNQRFRVSAHGFSALMPDSLSQWSRQQAQDEERKENKCSPALRRREFCN